LWGVGIITAGLTAFYMFRLVFGIFFGTYRGTGRASHEHSDDDEEEELGHETRQFTIHEAPAVMTIPLIILAFLSIVGGFIGSFSLLGLANWHPLTSFLTPVFADVHTLSAASFELQWLSTGLAIIAGVLGIFAAWRLYRSGFSYKENKNPLYQLVLHKYYVDEILTAVIIQPIQWFGRTATHFLETDTLDGGSRGIAWLLRGTSTGLRRLQTGYMRNYALAILLGVVLIIVYYAVRG
jgi:NADH-quinone oxidoreductase subunit L